MLAARPLVERLYRARGASAADVDYSLAALEDASSLAGAVKAASVLAEAVMAGRHIVVVGDYDADGATSTALSVLALRSLGARQVDYVVPDRFRDGYGLSPAVVQTASALKPEVLMTVDNGISSIEGVAAARAAGIRVVITDHHLAGAHLPVADAIVNPNQPGCAFPWKSTAGVGVAFYVMAALRRRLQQAGWFEATGRAPPNLGGLLDLVALGTVADVVPLERNNRILVSQGLQRIRSGRCRPGIRQLLGVAGRNVRRATASDLAFQVAPRLNAAGRLQDIRIGIACLLCEDDVAALRLAEQLDALNRERREIESGMREQASTVVERMIASQRELPAALCLFDESWHEGVLGIVAARIKDRCHRPVITFARATSGEIKGSGRSIQGIHLRDMLDEVATRFPGLLTRFGGHAGAAGLTLAEDRFEAFSRAFTEVVSRHVTPEMLASVVETDGELRTEELTLEAAFQVQDAGPWGQHFPEPLFEGWFEVVELRWMGAAQQHLRLRLRDPRDGREFEAVRFNHDGSRQLRSGQRLYLVYRLSANEHGGFTRLQLMIEHLRECDAAV